MGKVYEALDATLVAFIRRQTHFFVATAPLSRDGYIKVSSLGAWKGGASDKPAPSLFWPSRSVCMGLRAWGGAS